MKIQIDKCSDHYRADLLDATGSPPCGIGETPELAVAHLFYMLIFENTHGGLNSVHSQVGNNSWLKYIKYGEPLIVNDKIWNWPKSYINH